MRVLVTRPEPDASSFAALIRNAGHETVIVPFMAMQPMPEVAFPDLPVQSLIATSRNALRAVSGWARLEQLRRLPIHVVGEGTAEMARKMGFRQISCGPRAGAELAASISEQVDPAAGALVHLCGETVAFDLCGWLQQRGYRCQQVVVYQMLALDKLPDRIAAAFRAGQIDAVTLMSPETARIYARLAIDDIYAGAKAAGPQAGPLLLCLSDAIADVLRQSPGVQEIGGRQIGQIRVALQPRADELLALIRPDAAQSA